MARALAIKASSWLFLSPSRPSFLWSSTSSSLSFGFPKSLAVLKLGNKGFSCSSLELKRTRTRMVEVSENIKLSEIEKKIFDRLIEVLRHFKLDTQLRVAGGWVRDKLLGKDCYDIDIALDNMLGREFCNKVNEYLSHVGEETRGVGVIQCQYQQTLVPLPSIKLVEIALGRP